MEYQLNDLIGKIHKEGVEIAQKQADDIVAKAKVQAEKILEEAYQRSQKIRTESERETARTEEASRATMTQGARDLILSMEKDLMNLMNVVLKDKVAESMNPNAMVEFIKLVLPSFLDSHGKGSLLISESALATYEPALRTALADKITEGKIEIKPFASSDKGFKLQEENGVISYDFSVSAISEVLSGYINPRFSFLLKQSTSNN